jgi:hypothetical protein
MSAPRTNFAPAYYIVVARGLFVTLSCVAIYWGVGRLPGFWRNFSPERVATRVIAGDSFKPEVLDRQLLLMQGAANAAYCDPAELRSVAVIKLRMMELSDSKDDQRAERSDSLRSAIRSSLSCAPADPFLWLVLYSVEKNESALNPDFLKYLRMSYELGPNEGWIAVKRNRLAFEIFQLLPADLAKGAVNEFIGLLDAGLYQLAAETFVGPAWPEHELILARLQSVSADKRKLFAQALSSRGYHMNADVVF